MKGKMTEQQWSYGALNDGRTYTITVFDTTYEGWKTYLVDGCSAHCSGAAPAGWVALQSGRSQVFVRECDLPNFHESFVTPAT